MPAFPLFIDLTGKKILVFGGGQVALRKIQTLLLFQASVEVIAPEFCETLETMIEAGTVKKAEMVIDFDGGEAPPVLEAFMVICATDDEIFNHRMAKKCREIQIPVNSATSAADSDFIFPSAVVRGDIVCGVTSSGNVPVLTKKIREMIDGALPEWYEELSRRLVYARLMVKNHIGSQKKRSELLRTLADYGLSHEGNIPDEIIWKEIQHVKEAGL